MQSCKTMGSKSHVISGLQPVMVCQKPAKFGGHRHCGSGDMFLVAEEEDSRCSRFNSPLLFISKRHGFKSLDISLITPIKSHVLNAAIKQKFENSFCNNFRCGVVVITTAQLHSSKPELSFAQVQILLAACRRFAMVRTSDSGPS